MGLRSIPLFDRMGRPTGFLMAQWAKKAALDPLQARVSYVDKDRTANRALHGLWASAFPLREPLPQTEIVETDGTGTPLFWDRFY